MSYTLILWVSIYLMFFAGLMGGWWQRHLVPPSPMLQWAGAAVTAVGFGISIWARSVLGGNWSGTVTVKVEHELIRKGPYRWVRHPIYTGLMVAMIGTAMARDRWRGVVAVAVMWVALTVKRLKEERFMRQTFGAQYDEYKRSTGAIIPFVNL
jgi:protein-S-isoprenylcysteine O-methyltransferase Ste14